MPHKFILECFQHSLTGRLGHGLVHNFNGPLQILSMQMEMIKMDIMKCRNLLYDSEAGTQSRGASGIVSACRNEISRIDDRMGQTAEVIARLESMIQILGYRGEGDQSEKRTRPVDMLLFISNFIEFWSADLYFKHRVEKAISVPDTSVFVMMDEAMVLAMMDGIMSGFLSCIKAREGSSFSMTLVPGEESSCRIEFEHTGVPVPDEICDRVMALREIYVQDRGMSILGCNDIRESPELFIALLLGAIRSVDTDWSFELSPSRVVVAPV